MAVGYIRVGDFWYRLDGRGKMDVTPTPTPTDGDVYKLLASTEVAGSAVTSVDFTGLSLDSDDELLLVSDIAAPISTTNVYLYVNGNTTNTNYYRQLLWAYSNNIGENRVNDAFIDYTQSGSGSLIESYIKLTSDGYIAFQSKATNNYGSSSVDIMNCYNTTLFTDASITQLTISTSVASQILSGSKFWLYRINKEV